MDYGVGVIAVALPCHPVRVYRPWRFGSADGLEDRHVCAGAAEGAEQFRFAPCTQQVLQQVGTAEGFGPDPLCGGDLHAVFRVGERELAQRAEHGDRRLGLYGCAKRQCAGQHSAVRCPHPDYGGVVAFGVVCPVEVRVHGLHIGHGPGTCKSQSGCHGVSQGIGGHAVHHVRSVEAALACPAGTLEVCLVPQPQPRGTDAPDLADSAGCHQGFDRGKGF
ncbi:hypothetical protein PJL18_04069 [Paenarthrobacter nicotinovorans]|nr:hypothetical protein [Paenarthrobacter nicotinovorans]